MERRLGILLIPDIAVSRAVEISVAAEDSGFSYVWVADEDFYRDVYVTLSAIALNTKKIRFGPGCVNPYTRHIAMNAIATATLNEMSGGRAVFAVGTGGLNILEPLGYRMEKPVRVLREAIAFFKEFTSGRETSIDGFHVKGFGCRIGFPNPSPIPVYLACRGPQMLRLAGRMADGVLLGSVPAEYIPAAVREISRGLEMSGRSLGNFDIANSVICCCMRDEEEAYRRARKYLVYSMAVTPEYVLETVGLSSDDIKPIRDSLPDVDAASSHVTDEMVKKFAIVGSLDECTRRIREYFEVGVTQLVLSAPVGFPTLEMLRLIGESFRYTA